jgi:hypothetical protein
MTGHPPGVIATPDPSFFTNLSAQFTPGEHHSTSSFSSHPKGHNQVASATQIVVADWRPHCLCSSVQLQLPTHGEPRTSRARTCMMREGSAVRTLTAQFAPCPEGRVRPNRQLAIQRGGDTRPPGLHRSIAIDKSCGKRMIWQWTTPCGPKETKT